MYRSLKLSRSRRTKVYVVVNFIAYFTYSIYVIDINHFFENSILMIIEIS